MGIVQGLTEFLPISSSGHLILVPFLLGWDDAFINSLAFSVMLHLGTLAALLVYFRADWVRLVPAGFATIRDRSFARRPGPAAGVAARRGDHPGGDRRLPLQRRHRDAVPRAGLVAVTLVVGGVILWLADRSAAGSRAIDDVTFPIAVGIGAAQALALIPGHQPVGHLHLCRPVRRPGPRGGGALQLPDGDARSPPGAIVFEAAQLVPGRLGRRRRARAARRRACSRRSSPGCSPSASCCATCGRTRSTSSSSTDSCWPRSSSSLLARPRRIRRWKS